MKFNEEAMQAAFESFMEDNFWKEMYDNAPEGAKKRLRVAFWGSKYINEREDLDDYREYRERVENEMTLADAEYLAEHFPEGAGKKHYTEMREELETAALKTPEKLDAATEVMLAGCSDEERRAVEATRLALKRCDDPFVKYAWLWGAVGGNGEDCEWLGDTFDHGHGVERDAELAYFWFRRGAFCGHGGCCARLAAVYEDEGPRFDMEKAKFWFIEAIRRKSDDAKIDLGARLTTWEEGPWTAYRNPTLGFNLLKSASGGEHVGRACYFLGKCFEQGVGTKRDLERALCEYSLAKLKEVYGAAEAVARVKKLLGKD